MPLELHKGDELTGELKAKFVTGGESGDRLNLSELISEMDEETIFLAIVAANPELDYTLPNDPKLREDLNEIRTRIAQRALKLNANAGAINNEIHKHIHVHLWDEGTQDRIRSIGRSMIDFLARVKSKLVESKVALIDHDDRETISPSEFAKLFKESFLSMVDFMRGKSSEPSVIKPDDLKEDLMSAFPSEKDQVLAVDLISHAIDAPVGAVSQLDNDEACTAEVTPKAFKLRSPTEADGPGM
jgi:hypothetical protein